MASFQGFELSENTPVKLQYLDNRGRKIEPKDSENRNSAVIRGCNNT